MLACLPVMRIMYSLTFNLTIPGISEKCIVSQSLQSFIIDFQFAETVRKVYSREILNSITMTKLIIDFLYYDDCPHYPEALDILKEVLSEEHIETDVNMIRVANVNEAERLKFVGSPTIRINGEDVEPEIEKHRDYHGHCRMYLYRGQLFSWPPKEMLQDALKKHR